MNVSEFDYHLPPGLIAQEPLPDRTASRLLHLSLQTGLATHRHFADALNILQPDDLLVFNDTRVTARRLIGEKPTGGAVELLLLRESAPNTFLCLAKPGRRLQVGALVHFSGGITAKVMRTNGGLREVSFIAPSDWRSALDGIALVPLPPYVTKPLADPERYQTVYAQTPGSAAAPTAGLHFTEQLIAALQEAGVKTARVTLDVSLDTFRPMSVEDTNEHVMHGETCRVGPDTSAAVNSASGRIVAVGTTAVRTLESFATGRRHIEPGERVTRLFIQPGYQFQVIDGMFTNFHMPRTTMMLMISALAGTQNVLSAYDCAVREGYRFLSFGDSMLLL